jgi:hypothetical protein
MIRSRYSGRAYVGTLAEFNASTRIWGQGDILLPSNSNQVRIGNGKALFSALISMPAQTLQKAANVAAIGATANLTVIGAVFADLAAARSATNTLKTETEARLDAIEAKVDALLAALVTANLMA